MILYNTLELFLSNTLELFFEICFKIRYNFSKYFKIGGHDIAKL